MPSRTQKKSDAKSWQDTCQSLVNIYLKKVKAPQGSLFVLSTYGDPLFRGGKQAKLDYTTLGSLAASIHAASEGLSELMRFKVSAVQLGDAKGGLWFEKITAETLLVGWKCPWNSVALKPLIQQLKKALAQLPKGQNAGEALDGMTLGGLDSQMNERMGR